MQRRGASARDDRQDEQRLRGDAERGNAREDERGGEPADASAGRSSGAADSAHRHENAKVECEHRGSVGGGDMGAAPWVA
jgi:hypothetical protein